MKTPEQILDGFEPDVVIGEDVSCYSRDKVLVAMEAYFQAKFKDIMDAAYPQSKE